MAEFIRDLKRTHSCGELTAKRGCSVPRFVHDGVQRTVQYRRPNYELRGAVA